VFWIWDENNADNTLMFLVVARQPRNFQPLTLAWPAGCTGIWEGTQLGQLTQTGQRDIVFHIHAQHVNWGSWLGGSNCCSGTGWVLSIGWWAIAFVHHLFCIYCYYYYYLFLCFPSKLSFSQPTSSYCFPILLSVLQDLRGWLRGA